uniref:Uncharacterized protein n=1 Tax=Chrysemys picta bellii TaxID=8478 RepID=A0A8C3IQ43_CHRPI
MEKRGGGSIVLVSSIAGFSPIPALGPYSVSKTALLGLTKVLAPELGARNIRINCLAPGIIQTNFSSALWKEEAVKEKMMKNLKLQRLCPHPVPAKGGCVLQSAAPTPSQTLLLRLLPPSLGPSPGSACTKLLSSRVTNSTRRLNHFASGAQGWRWHFHERFHAPSGDRWSRSCGIAERAEAPDGLVHCLCGYSFGAEFPHQRYGQPGNVVGFLSPRLCLCSKVLPTATVQDWENQNKPAFTDTKEDPVRFICIRRPPFNHSQLLLHGFGQPTKSGSSYGSKHVAFPHKPAGFGLAQRFLSRRTSVDFGDSSSSPNVK